MQADDAKARGEEAGKWLREHFKDVPAREVSVSLEITEPDDAVFREVLSILFGPDDGEMAA
jgi:hypothetical protein